MASSSGKDQWRQRLNAIIAPIRAAFDMILPPRCLACGAVVAGDGLLCAACWSRTRFLSPPLCVCCGRPFDLPPDPMPRPARCLACIAVPPRFERARAALVYDAASRPLVLRYKHGDQTSATPGLATMMRRAGQELIAAADLIAPVPLHRWRLLRRQYNQAALLAQAIGRAERVPVIPDLLIRQRATASQGGLGRRQRRRNVAGAFAVRPGAKTLIAGKRVLLIDDVLTTGATLDSCARTLRRAGAAAVDCLTLARRPGPGEDQPTPDLSGVGAPQHSVLSTD